MQTSQSALAGFARAVLSRRGAPASKSDVEDVLSDAYVAAVTRIRNDPDLEIKNRDGWFRRVLFLCCCDRGRRGRRDRDHFSEGLFEQDDMLDLIANVRTNFELRVALIEALARLADKDRQIVEMSAAGHTSEEIARSLGPPLTADAVRQRRSRVLATLQKMLGGVNSWAT